MEKEETLQEDQVEKDTSEDSDVTAAQDALAQLVKSCESLLATCAEHDPVRVQFGGFLEAAKMQFSRHIASVARTRLESNLSLAAQKIPAPFRRDEIKPDLANTYFHYQPIGFIESIFTELNGCPRQGTLAPHSKGRLRLRKDLDPKNALRGLTDYSHVWLIFVFHKNTNTRYHSVVAPPKLGGAKLGVFATRSPHRYNNIGLTVATLDSINQADFTLTLSGVDLVDGTPILDLKPYVPADSISSSSLRVPGWVAGGGAPVVEAISRVTWKSEASEQLVRFLPKMAFLRTESEARTAIEEVLLLDIRTTHMRKKHKTKVYGVCIDAVNVVFEVVDAAADAADSAGGIEAVVLSVELIPPKKTN